MCSPCPSSWLVTLYCNDGDWVESMTALVEHPDGRLEIIDWPKTKLGQAVPSEQFALDLRASR